MSTWMTYLLFAIKKLYILLFIIITREVAVQAIASVTYSVYDTYNKLCIIVHIIFSNECFQ